jgi:hypothetical protein
MLVLFYSVHKKSRWYVSLMKMNFFKGIECECTCSVPAGENREFYGYSSIAFCTHVTNQAVRCDTFHLFLDRVRLFHQMKVKCKTFQLIHILYIRSRFLSKNFSQHLLITLHGVRKVFVSSISLFALFQIVRCFFLFIQKTNLIFSSQVLKWLFTLQLI